MISARANRFGQRGVALVACGALLALAACGRSSGQPDNAPPADSPLEQAARDANLVVDAASTPPTGLFERSHTAGRDALCFVPGEDDDNFRFGMVASFGSTLICEGQGTATQDGEDLTLRFADADCTITARYDGQSVRLAGSVPEGCARLCGPRASLSGVAVQRIGWDEAAARQLTSRADRLRNRPARRLCE